MIIHVVLPGETIDSIAELYGVTASSLIQNNELINPFDLVIGQTIVIVFPEQTYTVQEGDTLQSIADAHGITIMQLLRNNPFLSDREFIYPGENLTIRYNTSQGKISINGYAYPYINKDTLRKTLPFLTYLTVFNYKVTAEAEIVGVEDTEIIEIAKQYGVAPIMLLSTLTFQGIGSMADEISIVTNQELVDRLIDNMLLILETKGYYGVNVSLQFLNEENRPLYDNFVATISDRLKKEGYLVFFTITPARLINVRTSTFETIDYAVISQVANYITILTYDWGRSYVLPEGATRTFYRRRQFFDYAITMIPPEKIYSEISVIGYDWTVPFEVGITTANSLTTDSAIALANQYDAIIQYNEILQAAFFVYTVNVAGTIIEHIVWFRDARSIDSLVKLSREYGFIGVSVWNIMQYFAQLWLVINSQYEIEKVSPELFL